MDTPERPVKPGSRIAFLAILLLIGATMDADGPRARHARFAEIRAVIDSHTDVLPRELQSESQRERQWSTWITRHDREIRARLAQGDEDTIVNWMLFGGSFTSQPPAVFDGSQPNQGAESRRVASLMRARAQDLVRALSAPGNDERLLFARRFLEGRHLSFDGEAGRAAALQHLVDAVVRIANEQTTIDRELDAARKTADRGLQIEMGSRVFRTRGLSLDTSLAPNYALDQALMAMKAEGHLRNGAITRIAIIGPGLDFSDKDSGFDFYPQQTLQPFAVVDSVRRLQLGVGAANPDVVLLDISPRVIDHITRRAARAANGEGYTLYLPLARYREWLTPFRTYWEHFGEQIGTAVPAPMPGTISQVAELRAVRVRPQLVQQVATSDMNIITDRLDGEGFDLMVATNVLVYYGVFDQALALANIGAMLRPGGVLLSNTPMPGAGAPALRLLGSSDTTYWRAQTGSASRDPAYSNDGTRTTFGDHVFWYQRPR